MNDIISLLNLEDSKVKLEIVDIKESLTGMEKMPTLSFEETEQALKFAKIHNAKAYFAPVSIGSADAIRMMKGIALYGDKYLIKFLGIEPI